MIEYVHRKLRQSFTVFDQPLFKKFLHHHEQRFSSQSFIKNEITQRLLDKLSFIKLDPTLIFLEGFDSNGREGMRQLYPNARLTNDLAHEEQYDLILSNCKIHQAANLTKILRDWHRCLKPEGVVVFTSFGSGTLQEIKKAWQLSDGMPHINQMIDMHDMGDLLVKEQFKNSVMDAETLSLQYNNFETLWQDIRQLNEPLSDTKMRKTLTGKNRWQSFCSNLNSKGLALSYEIFYGYGYKAKESFARKLTPNESLISFEQLQTAIKNRT